MSPTVKRVMNFSDMIQFARIPETITAYREMGTELEPDRPANYDPVFNPVHQHLKTAYFIVYRDNVPVGRIAAIKDVLNPDPGTGFFGCFECENDAEAASALLSAVHRWLLNNGCPRMIGPATFNTNQQVGFLMEGSEYGPQLLLPYNPPYYCDLMEKAGLVKHTDLFSFSWFKDMGIPLRLSRAAERARRNPAVSIRKLRFGDMRYEALLVRDMFNQSMSSNWGFIPLTMAESLSIIKFCRLYADYDLLITVWVAGRPAGILIFLPTSLSGITPPRSVRMSILGVAPRYRRRGLDSYMISHAFNVFSEKHYEYADISMIHENNKLLLKTVTQAVGLKQTRLYRVYGTV
ncbi:MAG: hypothetical protein K6T65_02195 [Peptococcaceae bacterium]|nr:hypothetical protein [Peptococcaceae bacterium]